MQKSSKKYGDSLTFEISVHSEGTEINNADNKVSLKLNLITNASIEIKGWVSVIFCLKYPLVNFNFRNAEKDVLYYGNETLTNATHFYKVLFIYKLFRYKILT